MSAAPWVVYYLNGQNNNLSYEKEVKDNGLIEHKHYLSAGGIVFAMQITRSGNLATGGTGGAAKPASTLQYLHHDHLGSVAVVTDETGSVVERLAYDPWGKRRFTNVENAGQADITDSIVGLTLDRGFTMHEHLDEMGVIHMNGRIYDPFIGRFMSADIYIPSPTNLQSFNRYGYARNNPLQLVDPSGYAEEYADGFTGGTYAGPNADYSGLDNSFAGYGFSVSQNEDGSISVSNVCGGCSSQSNGITSPAGQVAIAFANPTPPGPAIISTQVQMATVCGGGECVTVPAVVAAQTAAALNLNQKSITLSTVRSGAEIGKDMKEIGMVTTVFGVAIASNPAIALGGVVSTAGGIVSFGSQPDTKNGIALATDLASIGIPGGRFGGSIAIGIDAVQRGSDNLGEGKGAPSFSDMAFP